MRAKSLTAGELKDGELEDGLGSEVRTMVTMLAATMIMVRYEHSAENLASNVYFVVVFYIWLPEGDRHGDGTWPSHTLMPSALYVHRTKQLSPLPILTKEDQQIKRCILHLCFGVLSPRLPPKLHRLWHHPERLWDTTKLY